MDFLESAVVWIPSLTGMTMTIYDGDSSVLVQFEDSFCFSRELQRIFTARGLSEFLDSGAENAVFEIAEPLESHLVAFAVRERWVLLGPYVEEGWSEKSARCLWGRPGVTQALAAPYKSWRCRLPILDRSTVMQAVSVILKQMDGEGAERAIKTIHMDVRENGDTLSFSEKYQDVKLIGRRYYLEDCLRKAISRGDTQEACRLLEEFRGVSSDLKFMSDDMKDQLVGAAIVRTVMRTGAEMAGLEPVRIDSISQEYAQRMRHTVSAGKLQSLIQELAARLCQEVRRDKKNHYSAYVKKAIDYMDINLSENIAVSQLAAAVGVSQSRFVQLFCAETGMTVKQYLARKRCALAAELLAGTELNVQEIGAYVGYVDNNYFSKVFKAEKGVSPREYRKKHWPLGDG